MALSACEVFCSQSTRLTRDFHGPVNSFAMRPGYLRNISLPGWPDQVGAAEVHGTRGRRNHLPARDRFSIVRDNPVYLVRDCPATRSFGLRGASRVARSRISQPGPGLI